MENELDGCELSEQSGKNTRSMNQSAMKSTLYNKSPGKRSPRNAAQNLEEI